MSQRANWLNSNIGAAPLLIGAAVVCALVLLSAMLIGDRSDPGKVLVGAAFVLIVASWTPFIPVLGYGVQMLPAVPEGLASTLIGLVAIGMIAALLTIGVRSRGRWHGKALSLAGVAAWILWGIACIPPA
jgi:peptidoglycan/LPS O-acetylase OafA/YrhL